MIKVTALGVAIDLGHLALSIESSKVTWNNHCHHPYARLPIVICSDNYCSTGNKNHPPYTPAGLCSLRFVSTCHLNSSSDPFPHRQVLVFLLPP
jgi:hypothetical protein